MASSIKKEGGIASQGIPVVATASRFTAPVHIDVGGTIYTSSLDTLTRFPESRLSAMFSGGIPIVLDTLKQHYFIDRDGEMFRHVLNYMRTGRPILPADFNQIDLLLEESRYYQLTELTLHLESIRRDELQQEHAKLARAAVRAPRYNRNGSKNGATRMCGGGREGDVVEGEEGEEGERLEGVVEVMAVSIVSDLSDRILISGLRDSVEEMFPEVGHNILQDARQSLAWTSSTKYIIRFPLTGYCKVNASQVLARLMSVGFDLRTSSSSSSSGTEHIFIRKIYPL